MEKCQFSWRSSLLGGSDLINDHANQINNPTSVDRVCYRVVARRPLLLSFSGTASVCRIHTHIYTLSVAIPRKSYGLSSAFQQLSSLSILHDSTSCSHTHGRRRNARNTRWRKARGKERDWRDERIRRGPERKTPVALYDITPERQLEGLMIPTRRSYNVSLFGLFSGCPRWHFRSH